MKKLLSFVLVLAAVAASAATYPNKFVTNATPENVAWTNTAAISVLTNALGTGIVPVIRTRNATAAALGAQQNSPAIILEGQGYNTTGSTSAPVSMGFVTVPVQGTTPVAYLTILKSIGGAAPDVTGSYFDSSGGLSVGGTLITGGTILIRSGYPLTWNTANVPYIYGAVNGPVTINTVGGNGSLLFSAGSIGSTPASLLTSTNWPALRVMSSTNNITLGFMAGTNETQFVNAAAGALILDTNYVASRFTNHIAGTSRLVISNDVLYFVTRTKTNVVSDGR